MEDQIIDGAIAIASAAMVSLIACWVIVVLIVVALSGILGLSMSILFVVLTIVLSYYFWGEV